MSLKYIVSKVINNLLNFYYFIFPLAFNDRNGVDPSRGFSSIGRDIVLHILKVGVRTSVISHLS
jgi:hypothetical protein